MQGFWLEAAVQDMHLCEVCEADSQGPGVPASLGSPGHGATPDLLRVATVCSRGTRAGFHSDLFGQDLFALPRNNPLFWDKKEGQDSRPQEPWWEQSQNPLREAVTQEASPWQVRADQLLS